MDSLVFGGENSMRPPNIMKIDIEGAEYRALLGAQRTLKTYHPRLIIEVHSLELENQCKSLLERLGYAIITVDQSRVLPEVRQGHNRWLCAEHPPQL
ncbi:MAG: FkbM family methyltransferase [Chloroflexi bacterium]|nr:FkbM family methyltransferase [Chloroflexota bacterium]